MDIIFMGTPEFAVPSLELLINSKHSLKAVVCQPDKARGRSSKLMKPPTKLLAEKYRIPVIQPHKIKNDQFYNVISEIKPDLIAVVAYGKILPKSILDIPPYGCVNVHASLLPKYRGAAPVNWAIVNGEKITGVTTMLMDEGMDTGDILLKEKYSIGSEETAVELYNSLSKIGAQLLLNSIDSLQRGEISPEKQSDAEVCYAPIIKKNDGLIDWSKSAEQINNLIKGMVPWPTAHTKLNGKNLKLYKANVIDGNAKAGVIASVTKESISVGTGRGILEVTELQIEGSKRMPTKDFLSGRQIKVGTTVGI